jgi:MFS family permease
MVVLNLLPVINAEYRWRAALLAVGIITFMVAGCAGIIAYLLRGTSIKQVDARPVKVRETISRNMILLVLVNVAGIVVPVTALTWIPLRFQTLFQMSPVDVGRLLSLFGAVIVVSAIFGGVGARILGRRLTIVISMVASTAAVAFLANPPNLTTGLLLTGLLGFGTMFYGSPTFAMVPEAAPAGKTNPGVVFGVFNTMSNGFAFFPPVLAAFVLNATHDFTYAFVTVTIVAVIGLVSALLLRPAAGDGIS